MLIEEWYRSYKGRAESVSSDTYGTMFQEAEKLDDVLALSARVTDSLEQVCSHLSGKEATLAVKKRRKARVSRAITKAGTALGGRHPFLVSSLTVLGEFSEPLIGGISRLANRYLAKETKLILPDGRQEEEH